MPVKKIRCFDPKCKGVPFTVNTAASRLAEHFDRTHYECDRCHSKWSVDLRWYLKLLKPLPGRRSG